MINNILITIIILHLIAGFGFMIWKLNGSVKEEEDSPHDDD
jgi:hypothetical protein